MNVDTAVGIVKSRLGKRTSEDSEIVSEMALVQGTLLERGDILPWFLLTGWQTFDDGDLTFAHENIGTFTLPAGFLREAEDYPIQQVVKGVSFLEFKKESAFAAQLGKGESDWRLYVLGPTAVELMPLDSAAPYVFRWRFYSADVPPALGGNENLWLRYAPDLVIAETCVFMGDQLRMPAQTLQAFRDHARAAKRRMLIDSEARDHANRHYSLGDPLHGT